MNNVRYSVLKAGENGSALGEREESSRTSRLSATGGELELPSISDAFEDETSLHDDDDGNDYEKYDKLSNNQSIMNGDNDGGGVGTMLESGHHGDEPFFDEDDTNLKSTPQPSSEQIQLYRTKNLAVPACYFMVGLVQGLTYPLINVYPLDLGATEAQQTTLSSLRSLPSCLKIIFGFLSDNFPIGGYRRKPYMLLGWTIATCSMISLLLLSDLSLERTVVTTTNNNTETTMGNERMMNTGRIIGAEEDDDNSSQFISTTTVVVPPENAPTIPLLSACFFTFGMGVWLADVMGDSLVAEKAKYETDRDRGNLQAICYCLRGFGIAFAAPFSTLIYNTQNGPTIVICTTAFLPLLMGPFIYLLGERRMIAPEKNTKGQCIELWNTVCSRAVWQPMGFVYIYILFFVSNAAWREFLKSVLGFTPNNLNSLLIIGGLLAFAGVVTYKYILIRWSWRTVFIMGILVNGLFSSFQILLIKGKTFGLDPFWFALGDDAVMDFILGTMYLPMCVMMVNLVPLGIEGASYSMFTTLWNAAAALNSAVSTMLLGIWDVSKETMVSGDLSGLTKLTVLTCFLQVSPILFVWLMPHSVKELNRMKSANFSGSSIGGFVFLLVVFLSVVYAIFVGVMNVVHPGWMGES